MSPLRLLLCCLPPCLGVVAWWAANESTATRARRGGDLVAMLPGALPAFNPLLPTSAMEQELVDLMYEPLLRASTRENAGAGAGENGLLEPVLASHWEWSQQITCWFASAAIASQAADHLRALDADRWIALNLDAVVTDDSQLTLGFSSPTGRGPDEALKELVPFEPLPVDFVRVQVNDQARSYHEHFMASAVERRHIRRAWFDRSGQFAELVICGAPGDAVEEMRQYYLGRPDLEASIQVLDRVAALREPVLEFRLAPNRFWPDQTPVTASDVAATVNHVLRYGLAIPNFDALSAIHTLETPSPNRVRVIYRRFQGAALSAWLKLPILPASWLANHGATSTPAQADLPPGTGPFRPTLRRDNTLLLDAAPDAPVRVGRIRWQSASTALATQAAFASGGIDLYWPPNERLPALQNEPSLILRSTPPRGRLLVMWNLRRPVLSEVRVREALALATDRRALIDQLVHGAGGLHDGLFQPGLWFSRPPAPFAFDLEKAASLLDAAGWLKDATSGLRKKPETVLSIELLTTAGNPQRETLARLLTEQWRALGIHITVTALPWKELVQERLLARNFDAAIIGLDFDTSWDQLPFWHSTHASNAEAMNFSGLADPETDLLLEALAGEFDPAAVPAHAEQLDARIAKLRPFLPLFTDQQVVAIRRAALPPGITTGLSLADWVLKPTPVPAVTTPDIPMRLPDEPSLPPPPLNSPAPP
jgi:ABC-type transport system substrate-binding protein